MFLERNPKKDFWIKHRLNNFISNNRILMIVIVVLVFVSLNW